MGQEKKTIDKTLGSIFVLFYVIIFVKVFIMVPVNAAGLIVCALLLLSNLFAFIDHMVSGTHNYYGFASFYLWLLAITITLFII